MAEETELCAVCPPCTQRAAPTWTPPPPFLAPRYHTVLDRTDYFCIKPCSSSLFDGFIVFSTHTAGNYWDPDPSLKNACYEKLQNYTFKFNCCHIVPTRRCPFFWCISDFTSLQMFYFEQFLKLVLVLTFFFQKRENVNDYFLFSLWDRTEYFQGARLD